MLFMLVLSVVNVSAAEKGTITINKAIVNESYNIYKVLDLETYDKVNNHYIYRAASGWETFLDGATDYLEARNENGTLVTSESGMVGANTAPFYLVFAEDWSKKQAA